ncbi:MAG: hypothetical protein IME99_03115 [Proteobacteria bacterium]|nr:hypothetical protein [Pseudomonadota bacterium]
MSMKELLTIWPDSPALSMLVWVLLLVTILYLARTPAHQAIKSSSRILSRAFRLASRAVLIAAGRLERRNRDVLLAFGLDAAEESATRECQRMDVAIRRDLSSYPAMNRKVMEMVAKIDNDYNCGSEVPPEPASWINAVSSVAKIRATGDTQVAKMLADIKVNIDTEHRGAIAEYRKSNSARHAILEKMAPSWRETAQMLTSVDKAVKDLTVRTEVIDKKVDEFETIRNGTDKAARTLASSSMTQFVVSGLVLLVALGGAAINFNLIALPMSEMVGGGSFIGPYKTSDIAAMVIIMVEAAMGLYLMEALRITKLFPVIGTMNDKTRFRMIIVTFSILFILASVEASLAYMRDQIAADMQALRQSLVAVDAVVPVGSWIPTAGQMVMGFILPFALTFVAIPLESFIQSSRTVIGVAALGTLRVTAFTLRLFSSIARNISRLLVSLYDLLIFPALFFDRLVRTHLLHAPIGETKGRIS